MLNIITFFLSYIQIQAEIINMLMVLIICKPAKNKDDEPVNKTYRKLVVDELPIFENQHFAADMPRGGALQGGDGTQRGAFSAFLNFSNRCV